MKLLKRIALVILTVFILLFALATWYKNTFSMDAIQGYTVNSIEMPKKMLIATQGSSFKDAITKGIVDAYKEDSMYINVIDALNIAKVKKSDYDVMVLMHTWENWKPPQEVADFMSTLNSEERYRTVVLTTSGQGNYKMDGVDAITGESDLDKKQDFTGDMISKIEIVLRSSTE